MNQAAFQSPGVVMSDDRQQGAYSGWIERSSYSWADSMLKERERGE